MRAATVVQQLCKSCRTCFKFYCTFYFTCDRSLRDVLLYHVCYATEAGNEYGFLLIIASVRRYCDHASLLVVAFVRFTHRRRSSVNFTGHKIFARKKCIKNQQNARILHDSCPKNYQNTRIFMIFARKIYKIPEFYMIFAPKMPEFYTIIARKIFFSGILGGHVPPPLAPVSYAYSFTSVVIPRKLLVRFS